MSHIKFDETVKKLYVQDMCSDVIGFFVLCTSCKKMSYVSEYYVEMISIGQLFTTFRPCLSSGKNRDLGQLKNITIIAGGHLESLFKFV